MWRSMQEAASAHAGVSPPFLGCHVVSDVRGQGQDSAPVTTRSLKSYTPIQGHFWIFLMLLSPETF